MSVKRDIMSDVCEKQTINFDRTAFEQPDDFENSQPPERIVYHSMEELKEMLAAGISSLDNGNRADGDEILKCFEKKYALR